MNPPIFTIGNVSLVSILITLVFLFVRHILIKDRVKQERFKKACDSLYKEFINEYQLLKSGNEDPWGILSLALRKHEMAVMEFRRFLKGNKLRTFNKAWNTYCYHEDSPNKEYLVQYGGKHHDEDEAKNRKELAIKRIEDIIFFSKYR